MDAPEQPLTRARARAWALARAAHQGVDPAEVSAVPHAALEDDTTNGGYAYRYGRTLLVALRDGAYGAHVNPADAAARAAVLDRLLAQARARNRVLDDAELGPHQRAALAAIRRGVRRVAALDEADRPGVGPAELPGAEQLLVGLTRWHRGDPTTEHAARAQLSRFPELLAEPDGDARLHPCPLCWEVAPWAERYPRSVCWACHDAARCGHGRVVAGRNTSVGGGFAATHTDDDSPCDEVTRSGGVTVHGSPCRMQEARFGGVVVEALPTAPDLVADHSEASVVDAIARQARLLRTVSGLEPAFVPDERNRDGGLPFVRVHRGEAVYAARRRGRVLTEERFDSVGVLLDHVVSETAREMAAAWARAHPRPGEDVRRQAHAGWIALVRLVNPAWGAWTAHEVAELVALAPYDDPA